MPLLPCLDKFLNTALEAFHCDLRGSDSLRRSRHCFVGPANPQARPTEDHEHAQPGVTPFYTRDNVHASVAICRGKMRNPGPLHVSSMSPPASHSSTFDGHLKPPRVYASTQNHYVMFKNTAGEYDISRVYNGHANSWCPTAAILCAQSLPVLQDSGLVITTGSEYQSLCY